MNTLNELEKHLIETGGYDPDIAQNCTKDEIIRMKQRGAMVYVPTVLAFFGMYLTVLYTAQNNIAAAAAGIAWAFIVYRTDKALMSSTDRMLSFSTIGRILFAILNSLIVAECIVAWVFADTIQQKQALNLSNEYEQIDLQYDEKIDALKSEIAQKHDLINDLTQQRIDEMSGEGGSRKRGDGRISSQIKMIIEGNKRELGVLKEKNEKEILQLEEMRISEKKRIDKTAANGISGKLKTLHMIDDGYTPVAAVLVRLLLLVLELMPLFLKFGKKKVSDLYDQLVIIQAKSIQANANLEAHQDEQMLRAQILFAESVGKKKAAYQNAVDELELFNEYTNRISDINQTQYEMTRQRFKPDKEEKENGFRTEMLEEISKRNLKAWKNKVEFEPSIN